MEWDKIEFPPELREEINYRLALGLIGVLHERGDINDACYQAIWMDAIEKYPHFKDLYV